MAKKGSSARNKGHTYERKIRDEFRDLGFKDCETSRYESKKLDDAKVDLTNTGIFNVQCKAVERLGNLHDVLNSMPDDDKLNLVFHKRNRKGDLVAMKAEDFYKLIKELKKKIFKDGL